MRSHSPPPDAPAGSRESAGSTSDPADRLQRLRDAHRGGRPDAVNDPSGSFSVRPGEMQRDSGTSPRARPGVGLAPTVDEPPPIGEDDLDDADPDDIPTLRRMALEDPDRERRLAAVALLGVSDDPEAISILARALRDEDAEVRLGAIQSLADVTESPPIDILGDAALNDPSPENRYEALEVLSLIDDNPEVQRLLEQATKDSDEDVRDLASSLLEVMDIEDE